MGGRVLGCIFWKRLNDLDTVAKTPQPSHLFCTADNDKCTYASRMNRWLAVSAARMLDCITRHTG
jgi:hypothetical protein